MAANNNLDVIWKLLRDKDQRPQFKGDFGKVDLVAQSPTMTASLQ